MHGIGVHTVSRRNAMEGHQEQENTLNQLLVEMDGELIIHTRVHTVLYTHCKAI